MAKKNSEETIPVQPQKPAPKKKTEPVESVSTEQTVPTPAVRKPRKKVESTEVIPAQPAVVESGETVPVAAKKRTKKQPEPVAETVQPEMVEEEPTKPVKRAGWIWLGILGMIVIAALGSLIGYGLAIQARQAEETNQRLIVSTTQYELSLQDITNGNLNMAKRRLEYVIQVYPNYPGAADKLAEVMVQLAQTNQNVTVSIATPVVEATKDTRGTSAILATAQQQLTSEDWSGLYSSVLSLRDLDPTYEAVKVDGLYYMALRNMGINNIKSGNLEVGLYQFRVAEQIGPIDSEALNYRQLATYYTDGGSGWGVNWSVVLANFSLLYQNAPYLSDFNGVTAKDRYAQALDGYGDTLMSLNSFCDAVTQYQASINIVNSSTVSEKIPTAESYCANPPATATPTPDPNMTPTPENK